MDKVESKKEKNIEIKLYELNKVRVEKIDLSSSKDRKKLDYILNYESFRLKTKDKAKYRAILNHYSNQKRKLNKALNKDNSQPFFIERTK